ncbi:hypothetical protein V8F20_000562 [Naviculisporaceae sp. PSN 640]
MNCAVIYKGGRWGKFAHTPGLFAAANVTHGAIMPSFNVLCIDLATGSWSRPNVFHWSLLCIYTRVLLFLWCASSPALRRLEGQ